MFRIFYWHIFHSTGFHHICNIKCRFDCRYSPQNIFNAKNFNPHKKPISLLNVPICTQGIQRTWWPVAGTIIVTGPYCKCMMVTTILYMVSIKSSRLSEPYILYMISIKSSWLSEPYVPIQWLLLVNSWNLWNYTLTDILNCSIPITISLNIVSKGQLTTSQLLHWFQSVTSHHLNQWWASMMHMQASVDLSEYTL